MQEIKQPSKKPLVYYYLLALAILLLLNATLFPRHEQKPHRECDL